MHMSKILNNLIAYFKIKKNSSLIGLVENKNWEALIRTYLPVTVAISFSFEKGMHIVDELLRASSHITTKNGNWAIFTQEYCANLLRMLRIKYPIEWQKDWKNEAYLGIICSLVYRNEEAFKYVQNAYNCLNDPPQSLILAYLNAGDTPDQFLSKEKIDQLTKKGLEKGITYETAQLAASLAIFYDDEQMEKYWLEKAEQAEAEGIHTPIIVPNVIKDVSNLEPGFEYEE